MAWTFAESWDLYTTLPTDAVAGYWDSGGAGGGTLGTGRFTGSRALVINGSGISYTKSSGINDAIHHIVCAFQQTATITGSTLGSYFQLLDGATGQCAIVFRSDGAILLTSGTAAGTVLATYTGAFSVINTWYAFEFEVVINNATGSFTVRKNGNTANDFTATSLNTRGGTANNYANKLTFGMNTAVNAQAVDDLFWRSDAASVAWAGDIRCYTRMPASDSSVQFSRAPTTQAQTPIAGGSTTTPGTSTSYYTPFIAAYDGTVGTGTITINAGYTGNLKCSVFNGTAAGPTTVLASATTIANPTTGSNAITFPSPPTVVKGGQYWLGFCSDTAAASALNVMNTGQKSSGTTPYASFPIASPVINGSVGCVCSWTITVTSNFTVVNEPQEDGLTSYVYDSTAGHADLYGIATIASVPASTVAVTTRAYMQKSDAGSRTAAVQIKSGGTTVASPTLTLTTSGFQWAWATYTLDPNTSAAWAAAAVDSCTIGPKTVA